MLRSLLLAAPIREEPIKKDKDALLASWQKMGGDITVLYDGNKDDHSKWKGVVVGRNANRLKKGDKVDLLKEGWKESKPGKISKVNLDGIYTFQYDKGGNIEKDIKFECLTSKEKPTHGYRVTEVNWSENKLLNEIPEDFGDLTELTSLKMEENKLHGKIPKKLGNCKKLEILNLQKNELSGGESIERLQAKGLGLSI